METISVIVPSRKRPKLLDQFLVSLFANSKIPERVEVIAIIDDDDQSYSETIVKYQEVKWIVTPREALGKHTTKGIYTAKGKIIFLCNDDVIVQTKDWDEAIRNVHDSFADGIYLAGVNDLNQGKNLFVFPIFSLKTFRLLDDFTNFYSGAYIDTHIHEIFLSLKHQGHDRMRFLQDVCFFHQHHSVTNEAPDSVYKDRNRFSEDEKFIFLASNREKSVQTLLATIQPDKAGAISKFGREGFILSGKIYLSGQYLPRTRGAKILLKYLARRAYKMLLNVIVG